MSEIQTLETWLWEAACTIRGPVDTPKFKYYIPPLIFLKRLSDVFDDEIERLSAGAFYTPREVAILMAHLLDSQPGMTVYDPTCGSGGLPIKCLCGWWRNSLQRTQRTRRKTAWHRPLTSVRAGDQRGDLCPWLDGK